MNGAEKMNESDGRQNCNPAERGNFRTSEYTIGWAEALICRTETPTTGRPAEAA